jgi:hypothetical protein
VGIQKKNLLLLSLLWLSFHETAARADCQDPVYLQFQARIQDRATARQRLEGFREFLKLHPHNPCREEAQAEIDRLAESSAVKKEDQTTREWEREAQGGLLAPGRESFPSYLVLNDPVPRYRARLTNEVVFLSDLARFKGGVDQGVLTHLLRVEASPVYNLCLSVDVPLVAGSAQGGDFSYGIGNIILGVRGVYGRFLGGDLPWVVSGGIGWGTGSSGWSAKGVDRVLNAAAYAAPYFYHYFRDHQTDYLVHAETELGVGRHTFALGIVYHLFSHEHPLTFLVPPDPVLRMFRVDAAWQMELLPWLSPLLELNGGLSSPLEADASHLFVAPGVQLYLDHLSAAVAVRIPLPDISDYANLVIAFELGAEL